MENLDEKTKEYREYRNYIQQKYGAAYMTAISKLNANEQYDKNGFLKPEYMLTSQERDALMYCIPELIKEQKIIPKPSERIEKTSKETEKIKIDQHNDEERYQIFLDDVKNKTIEIASNSQPSKGNTVIPWQIVGIEFLSWEIKDKYGEDVYKLANKEVPYEKVSKGNGEFYRMFNRDFSRANRKLGHIIHEGVSASPLMDLDLLINLLQEKGIPSYIDFETNTFYYNAVSKKDKTK